MTNIALRSGIIHPAGHESRMNLLSRLSMRIDEPLAAMSTADRYYAGDGPLSYIDPRAIEALGGRLTRLSSNVCRAYVDALVARLRIAGLTRDGAPSDALWASWVRSNMDQYAPIAMLEALVHGRSYIVVWGDDEGRAQVSVESARQVGVLRDPATGRVEAALKRVVTEDGQTFATLFEGDRVTKYRSAHGSAVGVTQVGSWDHIETLPNPLGRPPVVAVTNNGRLLDLEGRSELTDVIPLASALDKALTDAMVTSEYYSRPRRWASGIELVTDENGDERSPFDDESLRMWTAEAEGAKFGQLAGSDLGAHEALVRVLLGQIALATSMPLHTLGVATAQIPNADTVRAAEQGFVARVRARQATFGRAFEKVAALMVAVEEHVDPRSVETGVVWGDPSSSSTAAEADAATKLYASGILSRAATLRRLGYDDAEVARILTEPTIPSTTTTNGDQL